MHLVAEIIFIFLIVYLTGSSSFFLYCSAFSLKGDGIPVKEKYFAKLHIFYIGKERLLCLISCLCITDQLVKFVCIPCSASCEQTINGWLNDQLVCIARIYASSV